MINAMGKKTCHTASSRCLTEWLIVLFLAALLLLFLIGCCASNAEYKRWSADGHLAEQIRTGDLYFLYWAGVHGSQLIVEPNYFESAYDLKEVRSDPNAIHAAVEGLSAAAAAGGILP